MIWIFRNRLKFYDSLFGFFSDKKQGVQNVEENIVHVIVLNLIDECSEEITKFNFLGATWTNRHT